MQTVDKNGVHIEQCQGCRGIFLDRGELEQIASAENSYYNSPPSYQGGHASHQGHGYRDSPGIYRGGYPDSPSHHGHHGHRRKRSFFDQLFD